MMEDILTIFMLFSVALLCIVEHKDERDHSLSNGNYNYPTEELAEAGSKVYKDAYEDTLDYHKNVVKPGKPLRRAAPVTQPDGRSMSSGWKIGNHIFEGSLYFYIMKLKN
jgi:hypothetical protein